MQTQHVSPKVHGKVARSNKLQPAVSSKLLPQTESVRPMRIAVCISGLVRTYRQTLGNFRSALLLPPHSYDIFISTWDKDDSKTSTHVIVRKGCHTENVVDVHDIIREYQPKLLDLEQEFEWPQTLIDKYNTHKRTDTHVGSVLYMFYKVQMADQLRRRYEEIQGFKYDLVVRTRFDLLFHCPADYTLIGTDICVPKMAPDKCDQFGLSWDNDTFAFGSSDVMSIYSDLFKQIPVLFDEGIPFQAEILLHALLTKNGLRIKYLSQRPAIVKVDGIF